MADPIEAHYTPDGDHWKVAVKGRGRTLTGRAQGLIAARDKADQLAEQIAPEKLGHRTVVHLLNGDAVEFTTAYLTARLAKPDKPPKTENPATEKPATEKPAAESPKADGDGDATAEPTGETEQTNASREVPAPAASTENEQEVAAKPTPTPAPRTEAQTAHPAAQPTTPTPKPTPATRESRVQT